jgi:hypothetical protein
MIEPTYVENVLGNQTVTQTINASCVGGTIVPGPNNTSLCQKTASCETVCPAISTPPADWCKDGAISYWPKDAQGCSVPDTCQKTGCPTLDPLPANFCYGGTIIPGGLDARSCPTRPTCSIEIICPAIVASYTNSCIGGTLIPGGKDTQGCTLPDTCQKTGCPTLDPLPANFCYGGTIIPGGLDARSCPTRPTCSIEKKYYLISGTITGEL